MTEVVCGSQGGHRDEVRVMSTTKVRQQVFVHRQNHSRQHILALGFIFAPFFSLHRLISHMHVFVPPFPSSPLLFFFLIALLPIFFSILIRAFFSVYCFSACVFVYSPPSPLAVWKQCNSPFQRLRSSLISCTCRTSTDTEALSPSVMCTEDQKRPPFNLVCSRLTPSI